MKLNHVHGSGLTTRVRQALALLGIRRLLLGIHDAAFPSRPGEDTGIGSPCTDGAAGFFELVRDLGFDGLQLGPQGATSAIDPSPYDGAFFSRNPLSLALAPLARAEWGGLLREETLEEIARARPGPEGRVAYAHAHRAARGAAAETAGAPRAARRSRRDEAFLELDREVRRFREEHAEWLLRDGLFEVLQRENGGARWSEWRAPLDRHLFAPAPGAAEAARARIAALAVRHAGELEAYALVQALLHAQHARLLARARGLGLALFGDLQIGMSERDAWAAQAIALPGWLLGAPPSRTNPEGQAWNYPVLDPRLYGETGRDGVWRDGPAARFFRARVRKIFAEYDGVRIDHPHGLVCPWVYRAGADPDQAVREGARLFASPALPDHPELAHFAIARPEQIDGSVPRHHDRWVRELDDAQVSRYAVLLDVIIGAARERGHGADAIACEILSTQPYPLGRVIERHGLGRFRVTQKADLDRADDVYRGENASPPDWIMLGNHDTPPILALAERWAATGQSRRQAEYLATRLVAPGDDRAAFAAWAAAAPSALAAAKVAELFVGPARNVTIFFGDLFGAREPYNRPGTVSERNWSQRLPADARGAYAERLARGEALDLPRALALALRARGPGFVAAHRGLIEDLERGRGSSAGA
jgi:4-alpha-glucanotransferase